MAQEKKYKLGDLTFDTEQEYREAAMDLKRIKGLMDRYNVEDPEQAKKILQSVKAHPETFRSPYGQKFVVKLEQTAGAASAPSAASRPLFAQQQDKEQKKEKKEKKEKRDRKSTRLNSSHE